MNNINIPNDFDLEYNLLGTMLIDNSVYYDNSKDLTAKLFYSDNNRILFNTIAEAAKNDKFDILTVSNQNANGFKSEFSFSYYVSNSIARVTASSHFILHLMKLKELQLRRELIEHNYKCILMAQDTFSDIDEILQQNKIFEKSINNILDFHNEDRNDLSDIVVDCLINAEKRQVNLSKNIPAGITSGLQSIDKITHGWHSWIIILAARPSMGKTALALFFALNAAKTGNKVAFFSLEMNKERLGDRFITSQFEEITSENYKTGRFTSNDWNELENIQVNLSKLPIKIYDRIYNNLNKLISKIKSLYRAGNLKMVVIDYLQLIQSDQKHGNRNDEVSYISRELMALKAELNIPFLILSQLNREVDRRSGHIPVLADLRDSGAIEQDADMVFFLVRPAYYEKDGSLSDYLQLAKNRDEQTSDFILSHNYTNTVYFDEFSNNKQPF